jgi:hypothetical protein
MSVYSGCIGEPNFGVAGPATVGLTLLATALAAGPLSGAALNPARVLGPALVFRGCGSWAVALTYVFAQVRPPARPTFGRVFTIHGLAPHPPPPQHREPRTVCTPRPAPNALTSAPRPAPPRQLVGGVAAAGFSAPIYGAGPQLGRFMDAVEHAVDDAKEALRGTYRRLEGGAEDA